MSWSPTTAIRAVHVSTVGQILVRPRRPFAMLTAYYNSPETTAEAFRSLWFHTGNNAHADVDGFHYLIDRKNNAIRR